MTKLEFEDIQGLVLRGYGELVTARFLLLKIVDTRRTKTWLSNLIDEIRDGTTGPQKEDTCINIAFTQAGFDLLGLQDRFIKDKQFSIEFEGTMTAEHRQDILGDIADSAPDKWLWGGPKTDPVHVLLLLYAGNLDALEKLYAAQCEKFEGGLEEIRKLDSELLPDHKEHFGFRDGIAQPTLAGLVNRVPKDQQSVSMAILEEGGSRGNIVAAGEFLLGYKNAYKKMPASPLVEPDENSKTYLQPPKLDDDAGEADPGRARDFGRNGSYLVFRQLRQNVYDFWHYLDEKTQNSGDSNPDARDRLAAKMVGRWRSGASLVKAPDADDPALANEDRFKYFKEDFYGDKCPIASHIRRTNPRDSLEAIDAESAEVAQQTANKHRIMRRGRAYGRPSNVSMDPQDFLDAGPGEEEVGLQFICFNANIGRQFEFVQHNWINNPKFAGLYSEADPLLSPILPDTHPANKKTSYQEVFGKFVAPRDPLRQRVSGLKRFVDVRGGAYFFMPGINAIRYLANLPEPKG